MANRIANNDDDDTNNGNDVDVDIGLWMSPAKTSDSSSMPCASPCDSDWLTRASSHEFRCARSEADANGTEMPARDGEKMRKSHGRKSRALSVFVCVACAST